MNSIQIYEKSGSCVTSGARHTLGLLWTFTTNPWSSPFQWCSFGHSLKAKRRSRKSRRSHDADAGSLKIVDSFILSQSVSTFGTCIGVSDWDLSRLDHGDFSQEVDDSKAPLPGTSASRHGRDSGIKDAYRIRSFGWQGLWGGFL